MKIVQYKNWAINASAYLVSEDRTHGPHWTGRVDLKRRDDLHNNDERFVFFRLGVQPTEEAAIEWSIGWVKNWIADNV